MKNFKGITYGEPEMMNIFWFVMILVNAINVFFVNRFFSWQEVGFRKLKTKQLLWFVPLFAVLIAMWVLFWKGFASVPFNAAQWRLFAVAGFTTFLVGVGEEVMYRGIVLHAFLTTQRVWWAMLVSAIGFSLLHSVNVFGGVALTNSPVQLIATFLFGCVFAALMLKLNNIWPLIIFHWLWDFVLFASGILSNGVGETVSVSSVIIIPIEIIVSILLWLQIKKEHNLIQEQGSISTMQKVRD
ncbi:CPBP family intramembrane glutamic endopeptidase [Nostoc sp. FACHB-145]|nr:CPBP family intramembrane glutamic endopeptidase [Nostoc sp. FACHB-145]MBD2471945.1 CPBP family intramembrane metalloprotease [Nostoc sp. FACHB-145]